MRLAVFSRVALAVVACSMTSVYAQSATDASADRGPLRFEVASVKISAPQTPLNFGVRPGGLFAAANMPLLDLITMAHQVRQPFLLVGAPEWVRTARYDIQAKAPAGVTLGPLATLGPPSPALQMIAGLLRERFQLKVHTESRSLPAYGLVLARADKRLGPQLKPSASDIDCEGLRAARKLVRPSVPPAPGAVPPCLLLLYPGRVVVGTQPLEQLASFLSGQMNRMVVNRTGLAGYFDLDLTYAPDPLASSTAPIDQSDPRTAGVPSLPAATLVTAMLEQLGLKLEPITASTEVLVIDSISQLTEN